MKVNVYVMNIVSVSECCCIEERRYYNGVSISKYHIMDARYSSSSRCHVCSRR